MAESKVAAPNGVNVEQLMQTVEAIKDNPGLAKFKFRASTEWIEGGYSRTVIGSFYGAGQEDSSRSQGFVLEGDEPPVLLGENKGPNAVESVLQALASCLSVGFAYNAAGMGITVNKLEFEIEGDIDLHGFLGLSDQVRPGYEVIRLTCRADCDAPKEKVEELWAYVQKTSPVLDILRNPVSVSLQLN